MTCLVVPPYLLERLAERHPDREVCERARRTLEVSNRQRGERSAAPRATPGAAAPTPTAPAARPNRLIDSAGNTEDLPGTPKRTEGAPSTGDSAVDEAYDHLGSTFALYLEAYGRNSIDGAGLELDATVHYGKGYDNAFWNGARMVYGDGDGKVFRRFTIPVDVTGHELTHGVVQDTAGLGYQDQPGALNESVADVFGSLTKQRALGQTAQQADWLIGAGLFEPSIHGKALRSMKAPGTAYDDPVLGKDPQPAAMSGYVHTSEDDGGVHLNSGIPNHAFYLTATAIGGYAWERAGQIWYDTLTGGAVPPTASFEDFARATLAAAGARYGPAATEAEAVRQAWGSVGIPLPASAAT